MYCNWCPNRWCLSVEAERNLRLEVIMTIQYFRLEPIAKEDDNKANNKNTNNKDNNEREKDNDA